MPEKEKLNVCALPASWATLETKKTEDAVSGSRLWLAHVVLVNGSPLQCGE